MHTYCFYYINEKDFNNAVKICECRSIDHTFDGHLTEAKYSLKSYKYASECWFAMRKLEASEKNVSGQKLTVFKLNTGWLMLFVANFRTPFWFLSL